MARRGAGPDSVEMRQEVHSVLVENARDGMYLVGTKSGEITFPNEALANMYGYTVEEMEGMTVFDLHPPEQQDRAREVFARIARGEKVVEEFWVRRKDGGEVCVEIRPLLVEVMGAQFVMSITRDVTVRKRAVEALGASERKYRDLVENAFDVINSVDAEGNVIEANRKMAETLGYSVSELTRMNVTDFVAPEYREAILAHIRETAATGERSGFECEWIARDGQRIPVEINSTASYGESGTFLVTRCIVRDITVRRRIEQRLLESERLRTIGEMSAGVGHNFNNLLTAILARAWSIERVAADSEAVIREASAIQAVVRDAAAIARQLQALPERSQTESTPLDINRLVLQVVDITSPRWQELPSAEGRPIKLDTDLKATSPVAGSEVELREMLTNLVYNAVDAMPDGGTCAIVTGQQAGYVMLSVSDDGMGMEEETRRRLFEPFFTTKGPASGKGLGLFTAYHVVRQHKGVISVDSELGRGTTFSVRLPAAEPPC